MAAAAPQPTSQVAGMVGWRVDGGPPEVATPERPRATPSPWRLEAELRQRSRRAGLLRAELAEEELACRRLRERLGIAAESPQKGEEEEATVGLHGGTLARSWQEGPAGRGSPRALASQLAALATPLRRGCPPSPVLPRSAAAILLSPGAPVRDGGGLRHRAAVRGAAAALGRSGAGSAGPRRALRGGAAAAARIARVVAAPRLARHGRHTAGRGGLGGALRAAAGLAAAARRGFRAAWGAAAPLGAALAAAPRLTAPPSGASARPHRLPGLGNRL
ncbi:unnamed protein product [Prorocentrum cordatum]|uniref:Uncharacterized protein n=1 Tax=Prorocentrum cordatum TaxID=2364126 RepID=A0ABN9TIL4_9DINO|nr:unnamed protein product [Polarella glacialis]